MACTVPSPAAFSWPRNEKSLKAVLTVRGENQVGECPAMYRFDVCESAARSYVPRGVDMNGVLRVTGAVTPNESVEVGNIVVRHVIEQKKAWIVAWVVIDDESGFRR